MRQIGEWRCGPLITVSGVGVSSHLVDVWTCEVSGGVGVSSH